MNENRYILSFKWLLKRKFHKALSLQLFGIFTLFCFNLHSQSWGSGWVYIENVLTGKVIDVQGGNNMYGTSVWPFELNYSKAQIFRFNQNQIPDRFGSNARYIMAYNNSSLSSDYYLSVKIPEPQVLDSPPEGDSQPGFIRPTLIDPPLLVNSGASGSTRDILKNYIFTIESKVDYSSNSPISSTSLSVSAVYGSKQIWILIPVQNEEDTYFIQSGHLNESYVIEPLDYSSGGTLVLGKFNGSDLQKWRIKKVKPAEPSDFRLSDFRWNNEQLLWWGSKKIRGKLRWNNNTSDLRYQTISVRVNGETKTIDLEPSRTSYEFELKSNSTNKTKEHCFNIKSVNKWQAQNWSFGNEVCEEPDYPGKNSTPTPTPVTGISKIHLYNCHNDREGVRVWTYDLTTNNGVWTDHGTLGSQWQNSGCPSGAPKEISIADNHQYYLVATDCGNLPPPQTQGNCHKLTSSVYQGNPNGNTLTLQVN